ncbi:uncharacterized protein [Elaeis guineensis]|uniref:uncharacterized protein n=1 Tax=Elaeis guineensis var. tenera TaxID=51953 RepID=UPI003C6D2CED
MDWGSNLDRQNSWRIRETETQLQRVTWSSSLLHMERVLLQCSRGVAEGYIPKCDRHCELATCPSFTMGREEAPMFHSPTTKNREVLALGTKSSSASINIHHQHNRLHLKAFPSFQTRALAVSEQPKMEALGVRFKPDDHELLEYLRDPVGGRRRFSRDIHEGIDPYGSRPEQLQNVSEKGSYYYYANRTSLKRQTADGSGHWKNKKKQGVPDKDGQIVGYKRRFEFLLRGNDSNSTKWVMIEYTLPPGGSHDTLKAICRIYKTGGNQRNERGQASTNPLPPEADDEDIFGQLSPLLELDDVD